MASKDVAIGMIFLSQTMVGLLGNFLLLFHYSFLYYTRGTLRFTDLVLKHMTVANFLVILSKGLTHTVTTLGLKHFWNDFLCKLVFYAHRVGRGVCMGTTCLLSVFQAITISPTGSRWAELKPQASQCIGPLSILCWILNLLVNIIIIQNVMGQQKSINSTRHNVLGYCAIFDFHDSIMGFLHIMLFSSYDVLCLGLMTWASGSMVCILHRHKQQVQHIHRTNLSPRSSPESRVTQSILVLVSTFVSFYTLSSVFTLLLAIFPNPDLWLVNTSALIAACFPTVSPFFLMSRDPRIPKICSACCGRNTIFSQLIEFL
nr:vomeronasal type-1 receptor 3-like [Microcebus murinus]XP_020138346.1 vomeronasal type-1 receptor 3-like [Microcebus murinus]XP_020138347.1 vomeronasal type-1 receptor 3-like [Microcebus murinus]XP_020138348.1 vomeronasal type-1 receptor 3-like [Microcebus murinus]XP_020138349.1 vomeronasal type-1 receptor 3-like [Microcebus murinus]XP_020138350.1 vomeronasal type-1 receptor 3-like [Microcebus murinus]XP_020138351.1 vomeronasal type-1 receptor 3-like [Microcebus murinus]XP_020138352.1 vom